MTRTSLSFGILVGVAVLIPALVGCHPKDKSGPTPAGSASTSGASGSDLGDAFKPAHPGHVNQSDGKGGFLSAKSVGAPPPKTKIQGVAFKGKPPPAGKLPMPKKGPGHCGELDLGHGKKVKLDCMTDDYAKVKNASKPIVGHDDLMGAGVGARNLPPIVDHRKDHSEGPMLDQGGTLACTSFSLIGAVNHSVARYLGHPGNYSPMHSWARYHAPKMTLADEVNVGHGLSTFDIMPFNEDTANAWQEGRSPVDAGMLAKADGAASVTIASITHIESADIKSSLAAGQDVWFALRAAHGIQKLIKTAGGEAIVPDFDWQEMPSSQQMGHAILLSGYQDTEHGTFYLIHNSWGPDWGETGYAWIHETTLMRNISDAYVIDAHPASTADTKIPPGVHKFMTCAPNTAPDGVTSQCVPRCGDKGPRANGVCPMAGHCPQGQTNLTDHCVPAAPVIDRTVAGGVHVTCGESGCTYVVPKGQMNCSAGAGCAVSCPSPRFRLAHGPRGLSCTG